MKIYIIKSICYEDTTGIVDAYTKKEDAENCAADLDDEKSRRLRVPKKQFHWVVPLEVKEAY